MYCTLRLKKIVLSVESGTSKFPDYVISCDYVITDGKLFN